MIGSAEGPQPQRLDPALNRKLFRRLWLAQGLDAATLVIFMLTVSSVSVHTERNPLIAAAYALAGVWGIVALKLGAVAIVQYRSWKGMAKTITSRWYWPLYTIMVSAATASGIVGSGFNLASLIDTLIVAG